MAISKIENNSLASGVPSTANLPAGTVLQVVNAYDGAGSSTTSSSAVQLSPTVSITPLRASSKLLIFVTFQGIITAAGAGTNSYGVFQINEGASAISNAESIGVISGSGTNAQNNGACAINWATTNSALTTRNFSLYGYSLSGLGTTYASSITFIIQEIAA